MTNEIKQNLEAMETAEILDRIYKGYLTEEAHQIAIEILNERNVDSPSMRQINQTKDVEENIKNDDFKKFWASSLVGHLNILFLAAILNSLSMFLVAIVFQIDISIFVSFISLILFLYPSKKIIFSTYSNKSFQQVKRITWISFFTLILIKGIVFTLMQDSGVASPIGNEIKNYVEQKHSKKSVLNN
jgi:hypothetical protein